VEFDALYGVPWRAVGLPVDTNAGIQVSPGKYDYPLSLHMCAGPGRDDGNGVDGAPGPPGPDPFLIVSKACGALTEGSSGGPWIGPDGQGVGAVNGKSGLTPGSAGVIGTYLGDQARSAFLQLSLP
jgi:hypothetical protein